VPIFHEIGTLNPSSSPWMVRTRGFSVTASDKAYEELTLDTAQSKVDKSQIAIFFKKHSKKTTK